MSTYGSLQGSYSSFSDDEKLNYALKIALSRLQTDLEADWFNEPTDFIPKQPLELYKNVIPSYASIQNFLLIDPDVDGNGKEMVTDKTVADILSVAGNGSQFTLSDILDTTKVRDPSQFSNLPNSAFVDGASKTQIKLLGRNMFTRYKYWTSGLTGKNSLLKGIAVNGGGGLNTGTTPDEKEPFNAYITYTDTGSLSPERKWDTINGASENSDHKQFYNKLISEGVELNIIDPNLKSDLTKKLPFLKLCLQVLTYTTRGSAPISQTDNNLLSGSVNKTDNIGFHNPLMEKALGDTNGFLSGAGYQIAGWNGSSWKSVTTSYGTPGYQNILYFLSNPGFILVYGQKNIDYGYFTSRSHPPMITFLRYTGETFSDGIISQGDTLPAVEVSNDKDLFIRTSDDTIHRLNDDNGTKTWVGIGGSGGGGSGEIIDKNEAHLKFWIVMLLSHFESYAINTENSIKNLSSVNLTNCKYPTSEIGSIDDENLIYALLNYRKNILANTNSSWQQVVSHKDYNEYIINKDFWKNTNKIVSFVFDDDDSSKLTYIKDMINLILFKINIDNYQLTLLDKDGNENVVTNFNDMNFIPSVDPHSNLLSDIRVFAKSQLVHIQTYGKDGKDIEYNITNGTVRYLNYTYDTSIADPPSPNQTKIIFQSPLTSANTPESVYFRHQPLIQVLIDEINTINTYLEI
jgi:hypothetical protein